MIWRFEGWPSALVHALFTHKLSYKELRANDAKLSQYDSHFASSLLYLFSFLYCCVDADEYIWLLV